MNGVPKHSANPLERSTLWHEVHPRKAGFLQNLFVLILKVVLIILGIVLVFSIIFGLHRSVDISMLPSIHDGDLLLYYRLDKTYSVGDALVLTHEGQEQVRRVVATAGDTVDISEEGLVVNGSVQQESGIYQETNRYAEGISLPITLDEGQVFVLGDAREFALDSRIYGALDTDNTHGKVITILWRRNV